MLHLFIMGALAGRACGFNFLASPKYPFKERTMKPVKNYSSFVDNHITVLIPPIQDFTINTTHFFYMKSHSIWSTHWSVGKYSQKVARFTSILHCGTTRNNLCIA